MSDLPKPKKPRRQKSKRLNLNSKDQWEKLLKEVNKEQVPIGVLLYLTVNLKDGTAVDINVADMIAEGEDADIIEQRINKRIDSLEMYIADIDFHISVESVAKTIQPYTDNLLKNL
jgi:prefoldin subunit 5